MHPSPDISNHRSRLFIESSPSTQHLHAPARLHPHPCSPASIPSLTRICMPAPTPPPAPAFAPSRPYSRPRPHSHSRPRTHQHTPTQPRPHARAPAPARTYLHASACTHIRTYACTQAIHTSSPSLSPALAPTLAHNHQSTLTFLHVLDRSGFRPVLRTLVCGGASALHGLYQHRGCKFTLSISRNVSA